MKKCIILFAICAAMHSSCTVRASPIVFTTTNVNLRKAPSTQSEIITTLAYGEKLKVKKEQDGWYKASYKGTNCFICSDYVTKDKIIKENELFTTHSAPDGKHPKTYMDWGCITDDTSQQYKLMKKANIGKYGIITYKNRYCIALGSAYAKKVGTKVDLILKNDTIIPCVIGDQKADSDTDETNRITVHDNSIAEFIVDTDHIPDLAKKMGDMSFVCDKWQSKIKTIKVYK